VQGLVRVGYVPQDPVFPPGPTLAEIVRDALVTEPREDFEVISKIGNVA
jgi:hypothetical protein